MRVQRATDDGMNALYIQKEESQLMCSLKEKFECMYIYWLLFKKWHFALQTCNFNGCIFVKRWNAHCSTPKNIYKLRSLECKRLGEFRYISTSYNWRWIQDQYKMKIWIFILFPRNHDNELVSSVKQNCHESWCRLVMTRALECLHFS